MLKKLQNLLFEDEEEDLVEDEITTETPTVVQAAPAVKPAEPVIEQASEPVRPVVQEAPASITVEPQEARPTMQRIDVTQSVPVENVRSQARNESVFRETQKEPAKPSSIGITVDRPVEKKPAARPVSKPARREEKPVRPSGYQFQPVISPIFGVDEKDMDSLKTTTSRITEQAKSKQDQNVTPIISPMYGTNADDIPSPIQKTVEKSNEQELNLVTAEKVAAEDEIPEFSLDDILKVRDQEYAEDTKPAAVSENTAPLFPELNLWDDEPESAEDSTTVISKQD